MKTNLKKLTLYNSWYDINKYETEINSLSKTSQRWSVCKIKHIKHLNKLTFDALISLIDIYEKENNDEIEVKQQYISPQSDNYVWNIFSIKEPKIESLCNGYLKQQFNKKYIEDLIVQLCVNYLNYDIINTMKHSKSGELFQSDIFSLNGQMGKILILVIFMVI